jgi:hypothetical protein
VGTVIHFFNGNGSGEVSHSKKLAVTHLWHFSHLFWVCRQYGRIRPVVMAYAKHRLSLLLTGALGVKLIVDG